MRSEAGVVRNSSFASTTTGAVIDRIASSASADSDTPRARASIAKQAFSAAETRTVIEGSG